MKIAAIGVLICSAAIAKDLPPELMSPAQRSIQAYVNGQNIKVTYEPARSPVPIGPGDPRFDQLIAEGWTLLGIDFGGPPATHFERRRVPLRPEYKTLVGPGSYPNAAEQQSSRRAQVFGEKLARPMQRVPFRNPLDDLPWIVRLHSY